LAPKPEELHQGLQPELHQELLQVLQPVRGFGRPQLAAWEPKWIVTVARERRGLVLDFAVLDSQSFVFLTLFCLPLLISVAD